TDTPNTTGTETDWPEAARFASTQTLFDDTTLDLDNTLQIVADDIDDSTVDRETIWSDLDQFEAFLTEMQSADADFAT
ncbi:MAG: hypothetical protein ACPGYV_07000, partial [Phycisphaeraceae bacterium]